jgi:hypothetical protein
VTVNPASAGLPASVPSGALVDDNPLEWYSTATTDWNEGNPAAFFSQRVMGSRRSRFGGEGALSEDLALDFFFFFLAASSVYEGQWAIVVCHGKGSVSCTFDSL